MWVKILPKPISDKLLKKTDIIKIINNSSWLLFDKLCRMGLGLLVGAWVARYLGPSEYGVLAYALAYLAFFQAIVILGLDNLVVRDISRTPEQAGTILGTAFALRIISGFILWVIAVSIMAVIYGINNPTTIITALCGGSLVFQAADVIDLWFQSQSQSKRTVSVKLLSYLVANGIKVYLILNNATIVAFAVVTTLEGLLSTLGLMYSYKKYPVRNGISFSITKVRELLAESWPYIFSSLSIVIYMRIDQIMIKHYLSDKELGIYAAILPLATLWTFIPMTISTSVAPFVAREKANCEEQYWKALKNIFKLYALLGWLICIIVSVCAPIVVPMLFGESYSAGVHVLQVLVFTNLFINMGLAQSLWILNEGKSKLALYRTCLGALVCIVSNIILIPMFGLYGAAISAVVAQFSATMLSNVFINRMILVLQLRSLFLIK